MRKRLNTKQVNIFQICLRELDNIFGFGRVREDKVRFGYFQIFKARNLVRGFSFF